MTSPLVAALNNKVQVIDLSHAMYTGMPTSPNHPEFRLAYLRRHGDMVRADGGSAANEMIVTGGHVGTQQQSSRELPAQCRPGQIRPPSGCDGRALAPNRDAPPGAPEVTSRPPHSNPARSTTCVVE